MHVSGSIKNPYNNALAKALSPTIIQTQQAEQAHNSGTIGQAKYAHGATSSPISLLSDSVNRALLHEQAQNTPSQKVVLNTLKGKELINLDDYFTPNKANKTNLLDVPLILPTAHNIDTLSAHAGNKMNAFLKEHGIPEAPDKISYDHEGRIKLPHDYAYADDFKQALESEPAMARELQTIVALTDHYLGIQNAISGNTSRSDTEIALNFETQVALSVTADGKPYRGEENNGTTETQNSETTNTKTDPVKEFLDFMNMTPEERYYAMLLAEEGLTKEELESLPPEERAKIEEKIQKKMEEHIEQKAEYAESSEQNAHTGTKLHPLEYYQIPEWKAQYGTHLSGTLGARGSDTEKLGSNVPDIKSAAEKNAYDARIREHYDAVLRDANINTIDDHYQQLIADTQRSEELRQQFEERIRRDTNL